MSIGMIIGGVEALAGVITLNPSMIVDGGRRVATSYVIGEALEPVKELFGDAVSNIIDSVN